jgi:hypothetical protein
MVIKWDWGVEAEIGQHQQSTVFPGWRGFNEDNGTHFSYELPQFLIGRKGEHQRNVK